MAKKYKPVPKKKAGGAKGKKRGGEKKIVMTTGSESSAKKVVSTVNAPKAERITPRKSKSRKKTEDVLPFERMNYILLLVGIAIIGFGFFLLSLDDFVDATEFSISLYIAPVVIVAGFIEIIYAIMYQKKSQSASATGDA